MAYVPPRSTRCNRITDAFATPMVRCGFPEWAARHDPTSLLPTAHPFDGYPIDPDDEPTVYEPDP